MRCLFTRLLAMHRPMYPVLTWIQTGKWYVQRMSNHTELCFLWQAGKLCRMQTRILPKRSWVCCLLGSDASLHLLRWLGPLLNLCTGSCWGRIDSIVLCLLKWMDKRWEQMFLPQLRQRIRWKQVRDLWTAYSRLLNLRANLREAGSWTRLWQVHIFSGRKLPQVLELWTWHVFKARGM